MSGDLITQSQLDGITTISLNREDIGNRVSDEMAASLAAMINSAAQCSQAIVLRGQGSDFCLGREVFGHQLEGQEAYDLRTDVTPIFDLYSALRNSPVPTIAVVQGYAKGFGCALAAVADITLASDTAKFQFPEMAHHIMPTMAMSSLVDRVALKALMYLIYSTEEIDAARAAEMGLISKVVASEQLDAQLAELLNHINKAPLTAIKAVKEYAQAAQTMDVSNATNYAKNLHAVVNTSSTMR
jgi:enoyl-CoA hydratase